MPEMEPQFPLRPFYPLFNNYLKYLKKDHWSYPDFESAVERVVRPLVQQLDLVQSGDTKSFYYMYFRGINTQIRVIVTGLGYTAL